MKRKPQPWINFVICFLLILGFVLASVYWEERVVVKNAPSQRTSITEARGVWLRTIDNSIFAPSSNIDSIMSSLAQSHFNTLYPTIWSQGYTLFPSGVAAQRLGQASAPGLGFLSQEPDPLKAAIAQGHRQNIKVIPCFAGGLAVSRDSRLAKRFSDWLMTDAQNKKTLPPDRVEKDFGLKPEPSSDNAIAKWFHSNDSEQMQEWVWINPLHPDARQFIKALILEVVSGYDIDGIQFDEHFSWPVSLGYDSFTVYLYQREHKGKSPPANPQDPEWMAWRAAKLTDFVADISRAIRLVKPGITLSLASHNAPFAYEHYLQNWKTWVNQGLFTELIVKIFQDNPTRFQAQLDEPYLQPMLQQLPVSIGILAGTREHPVEIQSLAQQVQRVRKGGFVGFSFFDWDSLWGYDTPNAPQRRREVFNLLFSERALPPTFRRKTPAASPPKAGLKTKPPARN